MARVAVAAPISLDRFGPEGADHFGGAIYSASAAAAMGHTAIAVGPVGAVDYDAAAAALAQAGASTVGLLAYSGPTRRVTIHHADEVLAQDTTIDVEGLPLHVDEGRVAQVVWDADVLLGYAYAPLLMKAARRYVPGTALVGIDIQDVDDPSQVSALMHAADWVFVSWPSAMALTGVDGTSDVLSALHAHGARRLVLKLGPGGAVVSVPDNGPVLIPALLGPFSSTVGAGDVFNAVFLAEVADGRSTVTAAATATAAAAYRIASPQPRFATRQDAVRVGARRVPAFSTAEVRRGVRVAVVASVDAHPRALTSPHDTGLHGPAAIAAHHEFSYGALSARSADEPRMRRMLDVAHVMVMAVSHGDASLDAWLTYATATLVPIIAMQGTIGAGTPLAERVLFVAHDDTELVSALYAFAAGGTPRLRALRDAFMREV